MPELDEAFGALAELVHEKLLLGEHARCVALVRLELVEYEVALLLVQLVEGEEVDEQLVGPVVGH